MRITADTNLLVRLFVDDDAPQAALAREALQAAELVAVPITALCEMAWVLGRAYRLPAREIADAIRTLRGTDGIAVDDDLVDRGLALLDAGGDFADAVIAQQGVALGGETFCSFDRRALALLRAQGLPTHLPA